jgi:hypothetical protein
LNDISLEIQQWLTGLIRERVSPALDLSFDSAAGWVLRVGGADQRLEIAADGRRYAQLVNITQPFGGSWNPAEEGWIAPLGLAIPLAGMEPMTGPMVSKIPRGYRLNADVLWSALWILSRAEEVTILERDNHDRFPASSSDALRHGYLARPIVDEWFHVLRQTVQRIWPGIALTHQTFRFALSHDVDEPQFIEGLTLQQVMRRAVGDVFRRHRVWRGCEAPFRWLALQAGWRGADPYDTFDWIMDQAEHRGLQSTFNFLCGHTDVRFDRRYRIDEPHLMNLMRTIASRGHIVGLHPSYGSYRDAAQIAKEMASLQQVCATLEISQSSTPSRMHYLRWATPTTAQALAAAQVGTDVSLGYADQIGFRCGTCLSYSAFDPVSLRCINLRIQPLIAMDVTFLSRRPFDSRAALALVSNAINTCRAVGGTFTLCWHNSELDCRTKRQLFEAVLIL